MSRGACYSWGESGTCKWADACRFSHGADDTRPAPVRSFFRGPQSSSEPCYSFQQTQTCKFGSNCRFSHAAAGAGAGSASSSSTAAPSSTRPFRSAPKVKSDECFTFRDSGACEYGEKCRYRHGAEDVRDLDQVKKRANGVCYEWKEKGDCKWAGRCRFAHETLPEETTPAATTEVA